MINFEFDDGKMTKAEVTDQHNIFKNSKVLNQYYIRINRVAPAYSHSKAEKISKMVKKVSIIHNSMDNEEIEFGTAFLNLLINRQIGEISISFVEDKDASVKDFLLKTGGEDIYPTDGSCMLPYEYYFHVEIKHYISPKKTTKLLSEDYNLSGTFSHDYQAGDEELQMIEATFKPIKSWK